MAPRSHWIRQCSQRPITGYPLQETAAAPLAVRSARLARRAVAWVRPAPRARTGSRRMWRCDGRTHTPPGNRIRHRTDCCYPGLKRRRTGSDWTDGSGQMGLDWFRLVRLVQFTTQTAVYTQVTGRKRERRFRLGRIATCL